MPDRNPRAPEDRHVRLKIADRHGNDFHTSLKEARRVDEADRGLAGTSPRPWAEIGVRRQAEGELVAASARLIGSAARFVVPAPARDEAVVTAGAGVEASMDANVSVFDTCRGEFGCGTGTNAAFGLRARFGTG